MMFCLDYHHFLHLRPQITVQSIQAHRIRINLCHINRWLSFNYIRPPAFSFVFGQIQTNGSGRTFPLQCPYTFITLYSLVKVPLRSRSKQTATERIFSPETAYWRSMWRGSIAHFIIFPRTFPGTGIVTVTESIVCPHEYLSKQAPWSLDANC